eukprot:3598851-Heterocapsa_arctica.AAC.1
MMGKNLLMPSVTKQCPAARLCVGSSCSMPHRSHWKALSVLAKALQRPKGELCDPRMEGAAGPGRI